MAQSIKLFLVFTIIMIFLQGPKAQQSFSLSEAIEYAKTNNQSLRSAALNKLDADLSVKEFRSIGMPKLNLGANYQYFFAIPAQPIPDFITPSVYEVLFSENVIPRRDLGPPDVFKFTFNRPNLLAGTIDFSMLAFDGSYIYGLKAAKLYRELVANEFKVSETDVAFAITKAYLASLIARENKSMLEKNIQNLQGNLAEIKELYKNGFVESVDVDRLELSYENLTAEKANIENVISISDNLLKFQMGIPIDQSIILTDRLEDILNESAISSIEGIGSFQISDRPEYQVILSGEKLNEIDIQRFKASRLPAVRLFGNVQQALQRENLFNSQEVGFIFSSFVGIGLTFPIYDGGDRSAKIQRAKIRKDQTEIRKNEFENLANMEVLNAYNTLKNANNTLVTRAKARQVSEDIFRKSEIKFKEGVGSSLELSQAELAYYQAQTAYINALYDVVIAKVDLDKALGKIK